MRRRRFSIAALAVPLALLAFACSGGDDDDATSTTSTVTSTTKPESTKPTVPAAKTIGLAYDLAGRGDHSFNDAAAAGFEKAQKELGLALEEAKPDQSGSNREAVLQQLLDAGSELIFGVGFLFTDPVAAQARAHPDARFALVDGVVDTPNVASLTFAVNEGSYLVGAAAALTSKTGKIGFVGGVAIPVIKSIEAGYVAGAKAVKPDIQVDVRYITQPPDMNGFGSPPMARQVALAQYDAGVDVIYHAARGSGAGVFVAAKEHSEAHDAHVWAIGSDSDQYTTVGNASLQQYILTSMVKKIDVVVYDTIKRQHGGTDVGGTTTQFGVKSGGVDYSTSGGFVDGIKPQLEELKHKIADGSITVPDTP
ncbi:MAG: basic rane protein [Actinomycetota bacterium]|jgi:basic membrane protein A